MSAHPPPTPPANVSPKGLGEQHPKHEKSGASDRHATAHENQNEQGERGNMHQNTTNKGYQQG